MNDPMIRSFEFPHDQFRMRYVTERSYTEMRKTHYHHGFELYYVLSGEKLFFVNDQLFRAQKGDMVVVPPYDAHKTSSVKGEKAERIVVHFQSSFLEQSVAGLRVKLQELPYKIVLTVKEQIRVERILREMLEECEERTDKYEVYVKSLLSMLLITLFRHEKSENMVIDEITDPVDRKMIDIATYINQHHHLKLALTDLAQEFFLSPSYLSRTFKKVTGFTISKYIQLVRIREAQKRLRETNDKIIDIAGKVGFSHIAHFNKVFKEITNMSPFQYRHAGRAEGKTGQSYYG